jgi:hypothetical protein
MALTMKIANYRMTIMCDDEDGRGIDAAVHAVRTMNRQLAFDCSSSSWQHALQRVCLHGTSLQAIRDALTAPASSAAGYKAVTITHVDTSTGVLMDVEVGAEQAPVPSPNGLTCLLYSSVC